MTRTVVSGAVLAVVAALVAVFGEAIGILQLWPFLLAAAVGLAASGSALGRIAGFVLGALVGWVIAALRAGFLPDTTGSAVILAVLAVALALAIGAASLGRAPMWTALAGFAAFSGLYGPIYADSPTTFLADSPVWLVSLLVASGVGFLAAFLGELAAGALASSADSDRVVVHEGEVA
jgi:hypothetical protein